MTVELIRNPDFSGAPRILEARCHDRSPFITCRCTCGHEMHIHETQLAEIPDHFEIATSCHQCGELMVIPPGFFDGAFKQMRDEGWIR